MGFIQSSRRNPWWRISFGILLLGMILMRLVWMQLRPYRARVDAKAYVSLMVFDKLAPPGNVSLGQIPKGLRSLNSPEMSVIRPLGSPLFRGFHAFVGSGENLNERFFVRNHQSLLMTIVFFMVLMVRMLTSSWPIALMVGAMLMSRGRLLTAVGHITLDISMMTFIAGFFGVIVHCVRTAATISFAVALMVLLGGILMDASMAGLGFGLPGALIGGYLLYVSSWGAKMRRWGLWQRFFPFISAGWQGLPPRKSIGWGFGFGALVGREREGESPTQLKDLRVDYWGGRLLQPLRVAFLDWCLARKRWISLTVSFIATSVIGILLTLSLQTWYGGGDVLHLIVSGKLFNLESFRSWGFTRVYFVLELFDLNELVDFMPQQAFRSVVAQTIGAQGASWVILGSWITYWLGVQAEALDSHLILSLLVIGLCMIQPPSRGYPGFVAVCWTVVFGSLGLLAMALCSDMFDHAVLFRSGAESLARAEIPWRPRVVLVWLEPVLLSLGVAGIFNLWHCFETRMSS